MNCNRWELVAFLVQSPYVFDHFNFEDTSTSSQDIYKKNISIELNLWSELVAFLVQSNPMFLTPSTLRLPQRPHMTYIKKSSV